MQVQLTSENARAPTRGSESAAGYDLYSAECGIIPAGHRKMISTDVKMAIPEGYYGRIAPRSGLAVKKGIDMFGGVVDSDYRGVVRCILYNSSDEEFTYEIGDRIAQIIITPYSAPTIEEVEVLETTTRGEGGFGSTGKN